MTTKIHKGSLIMSYFLLLLGFILSPTYAEETPDFEDIFSIPIFSNKYSPINSIGKTKGGNGKSLNSHESFEASFPLFDIFPRVSLEGKTKDSIKDSQDEQGSFSEMNESKGISKILKSKKNPKDKVIMSFTEFVIPFMNHRSNLNFPSFPKKLDFFEDFFKDFPIKEFDEPFIKHKSFLLPNKDAVLHKPQKLLFPLTNTTKLDQVSIDATSGNEIGAQGDKMQKLHSLFHKPNETQVMIFLNRDENETDKGSCCGHPECKMYTHCQQGLCTHVSSDNEAVEEKAGLSSIKADYIPKDVSKIIEAANWDKLVRISLLYTIPIFIGIGGIIVAFEIIRKHSSGNKEKQIFKQYGPVQHC